MFEITKVGPDNFFSDAKDEQDVVRIINDLFTSYHSSGSSLAVVSSAKLLGYALAGYLVCFCDEESRTIYNMLRTLVVSGGKIDDNDAASSMDYMFEVERKKDPEAFPVFQYGLWALGSRSLRNDSKVVLAEALMWYVCAKNHKKEEHSIGIGQAKSGKVKEWFRKLAFSEDEISALGELTAKDKKEQAAKKKKERVFDEPEEDENEADKGDESGIIEDDNTLTDDDDDDDFDLDIT